MKRIVFCTELGGNYGHISAFIGLHQQLLAQGHELVFSLRSLAFSGLLGADVLALQAPQPTRLAAPRASVCYGDMLTQFGYDDAAVLEDYIAAWCAQMVALKVDLVLADHAPTALLAARVLGLPAVAMGTGFVVPSVGDQFAPFLPPAGAPTPPRTAHLLATVNRALQHLGASPLAQLGDWFRPPLQLLCTLPELDHYPDRPAADYWGPLFSADMGERVHWPALAGPKIFAYLTPKIDHLDDVLCAMAGLPGVKLVHIPTLSPAYVERYQAADFVLLERPVQLRPLLAEVDLVISQGGAGMAAQCALAGVRQVMIPTQMEQHMLAKRMVAQGLAYAVSAAAERAAYSAVFARALHCPVLAQNSAHMRLKYDGFSQAEQWAAMAEEISDLLQ